MIVLRVISYNGTPTEGVAASFDEIGGTIGRANENQMVLPDPERSISRVHAQVVFRSGAYFVVDRGSNPISINGRPLGKGSEGGLKLGDLLQIGGYVLEVGSGSDAATNDPFADLFGERAAPAPRASPPRSPPKGARNLDRPAQGDAPSMPGTIPNDWDPFAPDSAKPPEAGRQQSDWSAAPSAPFTPGGGGDTIDDMFGLKDVPPSSDPLERVGLSHPPFAPNTAADADPLLALSRTAAPAAPAVSDHGSELKTPWVAPASQGRAAPHAHRAPAGAVLSWDKAPRDAKAGPKIPEVQAAEPEAHKAASTPLAIPADSPPRNQPVARPATPQLPRQQIASEGQKALLAALLEGLAVPKLQVDELTPDLMRRMGQLLRESTRGTLELLAARAALKREWRADVTTIVARANNPLKFSPTVDVALQHLMGSATAGFLPPEVAVRDAFDDLKAHQIGVLAGMRAALEGVLLRFDPEELERKLTPRSGLTSLIPASRKARLWELFEELSSQLSSEAEDDFHKLFGKAFLEAYEAHIDQLFDDRTKK